MGPVVSLSKLLGEETPLIPKRTDDFFPKITPLVYNLLLTTLKETTEEKKSNTKNSKYTLTYANQSRPLISTSCFFVVQL